MHRSIVAFDFDGTITTKDTLWEFIRFSSGTSGLAVAIAKNFPILVLCLIGLKSKSFTKERLLSSLYKGITKERLDIKCQEFGEYAQKFVKERARRLIDQYSAEGKEIVVITASPVCWVKPVVKHLGIKESNVIGTELLFNNDLKFTGKFETVNCSGAEKPKRLIQRFPNRTEYELIAYGDSKGDEELLAFADKAFYREL